MNSLQQYKNKIGYWEKIKGLCRFKYLYCNFGITYSGLFKVL